LFSSADLDFQQGKSVGPKHFPDVPSDKSFAWEIPSHGKTFHVEAATLHDRIVFFKLDLPWERLDRARPSQFSLSSRIAFGFFVFMVFALIVLGFFFARKNLKQGRGDYRGAIRVASVIFVVLLIGLAMGAHYSADADWIFVAFLLWSGLGLTNALQFALMYVALEPYVRRTWPETLISWSRLLAGSWRNPLVGRDLLLGVLFGIAMTIAATARTALPSWFSVDVVGVGWPGTQSWREPSAFIGGLANNILAVMYAVGSLAVIFLVSKLTRSKMAAFIIAALFSVGPAFTGENIPIEALLVVVLAILWLVCLMKVGFLALCVATFVTNTLADGLPTFDLSRWYAWRGLVEIGLVAAIAFFAFKVSLGKKPIFGAALDD
jgi:serine/threonine-protein kinase